MGRSVELLTDRNRSKATCTVTTRMGSAPAAELNRRTGPGARMLQVYGPVPIPRLFSQHLDASPTVLTAGRCTCEPVIIFRGNRFVHKFSMASLKHNKLTNAASSEATFSCAAVSSDAASEIYTATLSEPHRGTRCIEAIEGSTLRSSLLLAGTPRWLTAAGFKDLRMA